MGTLHVRSAATQMDARSPVRAAGARAGLDQHARIPARLGSRLVRRAVEDIDVGSRVPGHAQVAVPGGKIDPIDVDEVAAALREAREEVGLQSETVEILGTMPPHETVTGFLVTPVVGLVSDRFDPVPEPGEVAEIFRVPFEHVTDRTRFSSSS